MWEVLHLGDKLVKTQKIHKNGDFTCSNCSLKFSSEKSLKEHRRLIHLVSLASPESFCCETCGKEFTQKKNMLRHQNIHLQEEYKCKECNSTFKSHRTLKEHNMKIHRSETYSCDSCDKELNEIENKLIHVKEKPLRYFQLIRDLEKK